jgi:hypothetical protein
MLTLCLLQVVTRTRAALFALHLMLLTHATARQQQVKVVWLPMTCIPRTSASDIKDRMQSKASACCTVMCALACSSKASSGHGGSPCFRSQTVKQLWSHQGGLSQTLS